MLRKNLFAILVLVTGISACKPNGQSGSGMIISPRVITEAVRYDSDDPAIWHNAENPEKSIVFGTDKNTDGSIYAFNLNGEILPDKCISGLRRPNNIDLDYGFKLDSGATDILVVAERERSQIRIFSIPDMVPLDSGGREVFQGEFGEMKAPMGISLYHNKDNDSWFVFVSRKEAVPGECLWQYELKSVDGKHISIELVRKFGDFVGEVEAIVVDDEKGHVYYSDEPFGIRKYWAAPYSGIQELSHFALDGFVKDREGLAIWPAKKGGLIAVSDQGGGTIRFYNREEEHDFVRSFSYEAFETDGIELSTKNFGSRFPNGLLVAMSTDGTFHYYNLDSFR